MTELWRPIPECAGYQASSEGRIRSLDRLIPHGRYPNATRLIRGKVLRPSKGSKYLGVKIDGRTRHVHELVLLAFKGPRPFISAQGRHLDGSKVNNSLPNLEWGTPRQNQMDRFDHGTACAGEDNYRVVQTEQQVLYIMDLRRRGLGPKAIADIVGCKRHHIKAVIYGQSWNWLTGLPRLRYNKANYSSLN